MTTKKKTYPASTGYKCIAKEHLHKQENYDLGSICRVNQGVPGSIPGFFQSVG